MTSHERILAVLQAEAEAIRSVEVTPAFIQAVDAIVSCQGKVITMGMGKAGIIAQKMAATLCSTGTPSVFLHPGEAAHGDLGVISTQDVILAYSTSGKTAEVFESLQAAKWLTVGLVIGITSHPDTPFRQQCHLVLDMGTIDEPCPLGLTPSASTTVMLAVSDAIALAVLEQRGFTSAQFGQLHRAGYLGQLAGRGVSA